MLIGIDGNEANIKERVGVNVWAFEILREMYKKVQEGTNKYKKVQITIYLSKPPMEDLPKEAQNWKYRVIGPAKFWTRWRLPLDLYLHSPRPDVFLSLSHYGPKWVPPRGSTRRAPIPRVVCIMDLSFLKYPEAFKPAVLWQLKNWTKESVNTANRVITISEFNKREIVKEYRYPKEKITVVYPGVSEIFKGPTLRPQDRTLRGKKYLLFVGTKQPKKNLPRLIEAFVMVKKKFLDIELVVVGKTWQQFTAEEFTKPLLRSEVSQTSQVKYLGYVPNEDLPGLYAGAEALVLPSLYEGFGIPAVEAMSIGTPVLASNAASLPEVIGDAGILFNPLDVNDMVDKIELVLSLDEKRKRELIKKGMIRARRFSWDIAANKIIEVLYER